MFTENAYSLESGFESLSKLRRKRSMMLQGKVAIVTGAGQGIGQGIANVLAREGAKVVLAVRTFDKGKVAADLIKSRGGEAIAYRVDVRNVVQNIRRAFIVISIVANQPTLHDINLLLRLGIDNIRNQARQLDGVPLLILEQLQLERLLRRSFVL